MFPDELPSERRRPWLAIIEGKLTWMLIGVNAVVFGIGAMLSDGSGPAATGIGDAMTPSSRALEALGVLYPSSVRSGGEVWRLVTCTFLHLGMMHILFNMMSLWNLGRFMERAVGTTRFAAIYMLSGIGGSVACLFTTSPVAGASGAIFGLIGAGLAYSMRAGGLFGRQLRAQFLESAVLGFLMSLVPGISMHGHAGGFVTGFAAAWLMTPKGGRFGAEGRGVTATATILLALVPLSFGAHTASKRGLLPRFNMQTSGERPRREPVRERPRETPREERDPEPSPREEKAETNPWAFDPPTTLALDDFGAPNWSIDFPSKWRASAPNGDLELRGPENVRFYVQVTRQKGTARETLARFLGREARPDDTKVGASAEGEPEGGGVVTRSRAYVMELDGDDKLILQAKASRSLDEDTWRPVFDRMKASVKRKR